MAGVILIGELMNANERDSIAYFICTVENDGKSVTSIVNELSASDKKFRQDS